MLTPEFWHHHEAVEADMAPTMPSRPGLEVGSLSELSE